MVKCDVLFEVRTESLYIIWTSCGFKGLNLCGDRLSKEEQLSSRLFFAKNQKVRTWKAGEI
jgi:hypothetical protein